MRNESSPALPLPYGRSLTSPTTLASPSSRRPDQESPLRHKLLPSSSKKISGFSVRQRCHTSDPLIAKLLRNDPTPASKSSRIAPRKLLQHALDGIHQPCSQACLRPHWSQTSPNSRGRDIPLEAQMARSLHLQQTSWRSEAALTFLSCLAPVDRSHRNLAGRWEQYPPQFSATQLPTHLPLRYLPSGFVQALEHHSLLEDETEQCQNR